MRECIFQCHLKTAQIADENYNYILVVLIGPKYVRIRPRMTFHLSGPRTLYGAYAKVMRSEAGVLLEGLGEMASAGKTNLGCDFVD